MGFKVAVVGRVLSSRVGAQGNGDPEDDCEHYDKGERRRGVERFQEYVLVDFLLNFLAFVYPLGYELD